MQVVVSDPARDYVNARGGVVYVRAHLHHCCSGSLTLLDVWTKPPKDVEHFVSIDCGGIQVAFCGGHSGQPHELLIDLRGLLRQRLVAYWDGCVFKL